MKDGGHALDKLVRVAVRDEEIELIWPVLLRICCRESRDHIWARLDARGSNHAGSVNCSLSHVSKTTAGRAKETRWKTYALR